MLVTLSEAVKILKSGHVLGMPTETVYGLAGRIDSDTAIHEIFSTKQRPFFDPLIVHVSDVLQAKTLVQEWSVAADLLARQFWPGPLTLVLPKSEKISGLITSGLDSVGIRCPAHLLAQSLIKQVGVPLAAPSANLFGRTSPTSFIHVESEFAGAIPVLDGGACDIGIESTVLLLKTVADQFEIAILREGQILRSEIESCLTHGGINFQFLTLVSNKESPGHLKHHYMPSVPLIYCRQNFQNESSLCQAIEAQLKNIPSVVEGVRVQKPRSLDALRELILSPDPRLATRELYQKLRDLSSERPDIIYFVEPETFRQKDTQEPWLAIRDRLSKAASLILDEDLA